MKRFVSSLVLIVCCLLTSVSTTLAGEPSSGEPAEPRTEEQPLVFGFDFVPFVGTSSAAPNRRRLFSLNIAGLSGGIEAFETAAVSNLTTGTVRGFQAAGAFNLVDADVNGLQVAGAFNAATGPLRGLQTAGGVNYAGGDRQSTGMQAAGALNINRGPFYGAQATGGLNVNLGAVKGAQIAPFNLATGHVDGAQIGVFNAAPSVDAAFGLFSLYWQGFLEAEVFGTTEGLAMTGIRHGSGAFYNVYHVGTRPVSDGDLPFAYGLGLGWRFDPADRLELSIDATATSMIGGVDQWTTDNQFSLLKIRPLVSFDVLDGVALFGGPTASLMLAGAEADPGDYALFPARRLSGTDSTSEIAVWPGFTVGGRFL